MSEQWRPGSWEEWVAKVRAEIDPSRRPAFDEWAATQRANSGEEAMRALDAWLQNATAGAARGEPQGVIGAQIAWKQIERQVFRVTAFTELAILDETGAVKTFSRSMPYGLLTVESPILNFPVQMPVAHRFNFLQAHYVYEVAHWDKWMAANQHDLLVTYAPSKTFLLGAAQPPLHFRVAPNNLLHTFYSDDANMKSPGNAEKIFGKFQYLYPSNPEEEDVLKGRVDKPTVSIGRIK